MSMKTVKNSSSASNESADSSIHIPIPDVIYFVLPESLSVSRRLTYISQLACALPEELNRLVATFKATLNRTNKAAILPYRMAWLGVLDTHRQVSFQQAMVLALDQLDPFKDDLDSAVPPLQAKIAEEKFIEFIQSKDGRNIAHQNTLAVLRRYAGFENDELLREAKDLLLQSVISIWAALETFVSDFTRDFLNQKPEALSLLMADEDAKKRIGRVKWTLGDLMVLGLDLSGRVGDLVLSENDLSDLVSIKAILVPLLGKDSKLIDALNDPDIFVLGKLRNLLAHRGGLVDRRFEKETNGRWTVGES